ncbi:MAG: DUF5716 family protein [Lachnospiraceae bacterium]|nr:DUF5716 family protein [Lachnospiraceae bacterium]
MIQATNELILGIDLNPDYTQVTYYHQSVREPMTLGEDERSQLIPAGMCQDANGIWFLWDGVSETAGEASAAHVWESILQSLSGDNGGKGQSPTDSDEILAAYLKLCIADLKLLTSNTTLAVMVTVKNLTETQNQVIVNALLRLGVDRKKIYVQDYLSSFYYYVINQKKELWAQDVALLTYEEENMVGYVLHIDRSTKPAIARVTEAARQPVTEEVRANRSDEDWRREKDRLFFELLKKVFERRTIAVSYLFGDYFDQSWAKRSIQFLCSGRRAYQGMNLYSRGACYAAMERSGVLGGSEILFGGGDMLERNLGMEMCIRGKESYYPLVNAGVNWYEAHHVCEFILHGEREIRLISQPMTPGAPIIHCMRLPGLPKRPDRATRLRMTIYYTSAVCCHVEVEDLGFGGLYKSSQMTWSRDIRF